MKALTRPVAHKALTFEGIRAAAKQTHGLLRIPSRLQSAIETYLGEYSTHDVKASVSRLSVAMRNTKVALQKLEDQERSIDEDDYVENSPKWQKNLFSRAQTFNKYRERDTCAYVASRMPSVYSAISRVLSEVSRRLPDFKPQQVFDYGAGPGTAMWAICDTWPNAAELANLVEQSEAMSFVRRRLFQGIKDSLPEIRNFNSIDAFVRQVRPKDRGHNLVIASYSLGELKTVAERISVARQLWSLTTDILIIIEPGTPRGSSIVREVRSHILCMENKRLWREQKKKTDLEEEENLFIKRPGAFVVAPCSHDGVCPLDGTDKYCHFSQRLERSSSQLLVKRPKGKPLRGYEDEKFSFVVLRRGSRPKMDWPLDRVNPNASDVQKRRMPFFNNVIFDRMSAANDEKVASGIRKEYDQTEVSDESSEEDAEVDINEELEQAETSEESNEDDEYYRRSTKTRAKFYDSEEDEDQKEEERGGEKGEEEEEDDDVDDEGDDYGEDEEFGDEEEEEDVSDTLADMGTGWGRIIFQPVRRGKRVILDVCCSSNKTGSKGMFDRITVCKTNDKVLHFQARRSKWGDLWPCGNGR